MYKYSFVFALFLSINCLYGQFKEFPVGFAPANPNKLSKNISHKNTLNPSNNPNNSQNHRGIAGVLPFFEDFSTSQIFPDAVFWTNSGVIINNTRADNAPSLGVATLDAFNINGSPYDFASPLSQGYSDTLTAKSIDLSSILPTATDVFLSFWWQAGGKVEAPDASDFLLLQGKDNTNNWVEIWRKYGDGTFTTFKQENIQLTNNFFHSGFQFRFLRFGRVSGDFDAWHLDYIYLDKNRTLTDITRQDVALSRQPQSYLKNYTAMPYKQYFANEIAEINTEIITNVKNLDNIFRIINYSCELKNTRNNTVLATLPITTTTSIIQPNDANFLVNATPQTLTNTNMPLSLEYTFRLASTDATSPVDFKVNDTIKGRTELDNYFAYDDGTAEYVAGIAQTQGKIAVQYKLNQPAVITDIDICFVPFKQNLSQETFILSIWKKVSGRTDEILFQKSLQVKYPTSPNGFVRFAVDSTKIVNIVDTFYVGIQQTSNDLLAIGFDKDNNAQTKTFFNIQGNWEQDPLIKGALMIRPVFDNNVFVPDVTTALNNQNDNQNDGKSILLFPNPSKAEENNIIKIKFLAAITSLQLYNAQGQIQEVIFDKENQNITTKNLSKGLYVALLKDIHGNIFSKKIVLE